MGVKYRRKRHTSSSQRSAPLPSFLPGVRGAASWHVRAPKDGETPHTINHFGGKAELVIPMGNDYEAKHTRLHEMLHAAHSPLEGPQTIPNPLGEGTLSGKSIMHGEELRIQLYTRALIGADNMMHDRSAQDVAQYVHMISTATTAEEIFDALCWFLVIWPHMKRWAWKPSSLDIRRIAKAFYVDKKMEVPDYLVNDEASDPHAVKIADIHPGLMRTVDTIYSTLERQWGEMFKTQQIAEYTTTLQTALILDTQGRWTAEKAEERIAAGTYDKSKSTVSERKQAQHDANEKLKQDMLEEIMQGSDGIPEDFEDIAKEIIAEERAESIHQTSLANEVDRKKMRTTKFAEWDKDTEEGPNVEWEKMRITEASMTLKLPRFDNARSKYKAAEQGAIPRYPHRAFTDGKVFSRRRKNPGGSVLIDDSGSMCLSSDQVFDLLKAAPAVVVAAYSGTYGGGELKIIAKDGKYADVSKRYNMPSGGNNLVDFPALEWLAEQPHPRIWVTDGWVVPTKGTHAQGLVQCIKFCYENNINRVDTADDAHDVFIGKRSLIR